MTAELICGPFIPVPPEAEREWQISALCREVDNDIFFPEKGGSTKEAKKVCTGCEVRSECLDYALDADERFGIWGGLSERERRRLKRNRNNETADGPRPIPMPIPKQRKDTPIDPLPKATPRYDFPVTVTYTQPTMPSVPDRDRRSEFLRDLTESGGTIEGGQLWKLQKRLSLLEGEAFVAFLRKHEEGGVIEVEWSGTRTAACVSITELGEELMDSVKTTRGSTGGYSVLILLRALESLGGSCMDSNGFAGRKLLGATDIRQDQLPQILYKAQTDGLIKREVRGKRTFRIDLTDLGRKKLGVGEVAIAAIPAKQAKPEQSAVEATPVLTPEADTQEPKHKVRKSRSGLSRDERTSRLLNLLKENGGILEGTAISSLLDLLGYESPFGAINFVRSLEMRGLVERKVNGRKPVYLKLLPAGKEHLTGLPENQAPEPMPEQPEEAKETLLQLQFVHVSALAESLKQRVATLEGENSRLILAIASGRQERDQLEARIRQLEEEARLRSLRSIPRQSLRT